MGMPHYPLDDSDHSYIPAIFRHGSGVGRLSFLAVILSTWIIPFGAGLLLWSDGLHYLQKVNCELPVDRYSLEEILSERRDKVKWGPFDFRDGDWEIVDGYAVDVYKGNCIITLNRLYEKGERRDQGLRKYIKSLL